MKQLNFLEEKLSTEQEQEGCNGAKEWQSYSRRIKENQNRFELIITIRNNKYYIKRVYTVLISLSKGERAKGIWYSYYLLILFFLPQLSNRQINTWTYARNCMRLSCRNIEGTISAASKNWY